MPVMHRMRLIDLREIGEQQAPAARVGEQAAERGSGTMFSLTSAFLFAIVAVAVRGFVKQRFQR